MHRPRFSLAASKEFSVIYIAPWGYARSFWLLLGVFYDGTLKQLVKKKKKMVLMEKF